MMKTVIKILTVFIITGFILIVGFRSYKAVNDRKNKALVKNEVSATPVVQVHKIAKGTITTTIPVTAEVRAMHEVNIVPKVTGRLERLRLPDDTLLEEGVSVTKGQEIAVIEHGALNAAVNHAQAAIEVAKASLARSEVNQEDAAREMKRWENLYAKDAASEDSRDKAITAYKRALADVALCKSQIAQAEAALQQSNVNLDEAVIDAPISGVVSVKYMDEGSMVGPGIPLVRIVQIDTVKVVGSVSERHVASIVPSRTPVRLVSDALPGAEIKGVVFMIGVEADPLTRTVNLETRIPNPEGKLKPGMFVRMMVDVVTRENTTVIPDTALVRQGDQAFVYVVKESRVERRQVILGIAEGDRHEVLEGLKPDETVAASGRNLLKDGDLVEVLKEEKE
jgi:RND family efflux transporter MFP subunit